MLLPLSMEQVNVTLCPALTVTRCSKAQREPGASTTMLIESPTVGLDLAIARSPLLTTAEA
jgi:hypothetical protein